MGAQSKSYLPIGLPHSLIDSVHFLVMWCSLNQFYSMLIAPFPELLRYQLTTCVNMDLVAVFFKRVAWEWSVGINDFFKGFNDVFGRRDFQSFLPVEPCVSITETKILSYICQGGFLCLRSVWYDLCSRHEL